MDLKETCDINIFKNKDIPINLSKEILGMPESGFKEFETSKKVYKSFKKLGMTDIKSGIARTGIKAKLSTGKPGPKIAIIGELDALSVPGHPNENKNSNAAHACGHHIQIGNIFAVLIGLLDKKILDELCGEIIFFAVPAEEFVEIEWRNSLREKKEIEFLSGKQEMIKLGSFDEIDIAIMTHATPREIKFSYGGSNNGLVAKFIEFTGKASHAGVSPDKGINALNAANIALTAINSQRETFKDEDHIRVHPIITKGGSVVSAVPDSVKMETFVRGANIDAIINANNKIDRCLKAGALATGSKVNITTIAGYLPIKNDKNLLEIYKKNLLRNFNSNEIIENQHIGGSTDMGDLSNLVPSIHPYVGGSTGNSLHAKDLVVENYDLSVIDAGRMMAHTVIDLLENDASIANDVINNFKPNFTKENYLKFLRDLMKEEEFKF